jgi:hypothetical protein
MPTSLRFARRSLIAFAVGASMLKAAHANDSSAELATGGLVLTKDADIKMRSEDLFVSTSEIRVKYRFVNKAAADKTITVAFPMPDISVSGPDDEIAMPTENPENILDFSTLADGRAVTSRVEQKVFAKGQERTSLLRKLGVPLHPRLRATDKALDALPKAQWDELIKLGLAEIEEYDDGKGMQKHLEARWTLKTTYYWDQVFPAGKELFVEHRYKPSVGGSVGTSLGQKASEKESWYQDYLRKYCIDASFLAAIERAKVAAKSDFPPLQEQRIAYILRTGGNWAGPIKSFRLVVDKGAPDNIVSFCGQGVKKISPTQFEMTKTDFTPQADLDVLILSKQPGG